MNFLNATYGEGSMNLLARPQQGPNGSYGGGEHVAGTTTSKRPVLVINGITGFASDYFQTRDYFLSNGYSPEEFYMTTYWDGTASPSETLKCLYCKEIRLFILAVSTFTNSQVDILAYSMGSPVARKAIMGGNCVDTSEVLGASMSSSVHHFVSIAGPNYGVKDCTSFFYSFLATCNTNNGMRCNSVYLNNINTGSHYEGDTIHTIYSSTDNVIGYKVSCGNTVTGNIPGQNAAYLYTGLTHTQTFFNTLDRQLSIITSP
uniref:Lipase n=1 Tax=Ditylenchus dipsaci TaxID=166011 RepID=A0A915DT23_9BILA